MVLKLGYTDWVSSFPTLK